jgi:hypothetical protein
MVTGKRLITGKMGSARIADVDNYLNGHSGHYSHSG